MVRQLDEATRVFCSQPPYVEIRDDAQVISLSAIFDWYRSDFQGHARRLGVGRTVLNFVIHFADPELAERLRRVRGDYEIRYREYDWSLNAPAE